MRLSAAVTTMTMIGLLCLAGSCLQNDGSVSSGKSLLSR